MLRRILFRPIFFISFVLFIALFFIFSANSGESFNFFKVWTVNQNLKVGSNYVKTSDINTPIIGGVLAQLRVGNGTLYGRRSSSSTLGLEAEAENLVNTDILQLLRESRDPSAVFDLHLAQTEQVLNDMETTFESLTQTSFDKQNASNDCLEQKRSGDQEFFQGVNEDNEALRKAGLDTSLEFAPCYITNRVESNAYAYLAQKSIAYQSVLSQRKNTLEANRDLLLESYPLLHGNVAEQLVSLKNTLNQVNQTQFTDFDDFFSFGLPQNGDLPKLQNVFFKDNSFEIPNYVDPLKGFGAEISARE